MANLLAATTQKLKSLVQIEREERESSSNLSTVSGKASASTGAKITSSSTKSSGSSSSSGTGMTTKSLPQIEREERESGNGSAESKVTGKASGGVGGELAGASGSSSSGASSSANNVSQAIGAAQSALDKIGAQLAQSKDQYSQAALLSKLPADFPIDRWDNMSTREQNTIMRRSGLTVQEQWQLLNATTPMKALAVLNAVQRGLADGTLTKQEAAELTGGSLGYAEAKKQLASGDASILPPLQKNLLRGQLEEVIDSIRSNVEGVTQRSDSNITENDDQRTSAKNDPANEGSKKPNTQQIQMFLKGESISHTLRDGEYYFVEETAVLGNIIVGHTVLFDEDKYAEYRYVGLAIGKSFVPTDHLWVKGYVNNVYDVQDYEGPFFNMAAGIGPVGASASIGYNKNRNAYVVSGSEVAQQIFAGLSMSYLEYKCSTTDWIFDEAPISWGDTIYDHAFGNYTPRKA